MALNMPWRELYQIEEIKGAVTDIDITEIGQGSKIVQLRSLKTRVTSPGAASPVLRVLDRAVMRNGGVTCVCVPDEMMMSAATSGKLHFTFLQL